MNKTRIITATCITAAALTGFGAIAANATEPTPTPVEGWWALPNGGTPENVTWPQPVANPNALECGIWHQVDTYPSQEALDALAADGILSNGEDHGVVISWRFVKGADCVPPVEEPPVDEPPVVVPPVDPPVEVPPVVTPPVEPPVTPPVAAPPVVNPPVTEPPTERVLAFTGPVSQQFALPALATILLGLGLTVAARIRKAIGS